MFKDTLRQFVNSQLMPGATAWQHPGRYPTETVDGLRQLGLFGITVPEEY